MPSASSGRGSRREKVRQSSTVEWKERGEEGLRILNTIVCYTLLSQSRNTVIIGFAPHIAYHSSGRRHICSSRGTLGGTSAAGGSGFRRP